MNLKKERTRPDILVTFWIMRVMESDPLNDNNSFKEETNYLECQYSKSDVFAL